MAKKAHILPHLPPTIDYSKLIREIGETNRAIGELKGQISRLPNPSLIMAPLMTKEAVASSKIEGTQATIEEVYKYEAEGKNTENNSKEQDISEIINYRKAIKEAVSLIEKRPIGENFIKKIHSTLLDSVRGTTKDIGNFRRIPVYIGKLGDPMEKANYVPPDAQHLSELINNWEKYVNSETELDPLVQIAVSHYQFEAIHPFLDGNGRIGRVLIPIMLFDKKLLDFPMLYVSDYFESNRDKYYYFLRRVDEHQDWEAWIKFFLEALKNQAIDTQKKVSSMFDLYNQVKERLVKFNSQYSINLLDIIFDHPVVSFVNIKNKIQASSPQTVFNLLKKFEEAEILKLVGQSKRNKIYVFSELMDIVKH